MRPFKNMFWIVTIFILSQTTFAQTGSEHCRLILQNGLYKTFNVTKTSNFSQDIRSYFESDTFKQDLRNGKWEGNVGVVIEGVPISIGAGASDSEIITFQQRIRTASSFSLSQAFYEQVRIAVPDVEIARAYTECLEATAEYGFKLIPTINERDVIFIVTYRKQNSVDPMPKVMLFDVKNGTNIQKPFVIGGLLQDSNAITADRNPEKDLSLILQTDKGSVVYRLPAESSGFNKDIPVGTIITSYLNWTEFQSITQNNANNPAGPFWTARYSKWAPADGRPVPASKFQTAASQPNIPDLRAMFIRGLNSFDPADEPSPLPDERRDSINRARGNYQPDSLRTHNHDVTDNGHNHRLPGRILIDKNGGFGHGGPHNGGASTNDSEDTKFTALVPSGITLNNFGGPETQPKNVAIYYYIRIN